MTKTAKTARKEPLQARSREVVRAIYEAAARVLVDNADRIDTNRVARVAGVSIGSVYQYFAGKDAIVAGLVERQIRQKFERIERELGKLAGRPAAEIVERLIDLVVAMKLDDLRLDQRLLLAFPRLGDVGRVLELDRRMTTVLAGALLRGRSDLTPDAAELRAFVVLQSVRAVVLAASLVRPDDLTEGRVARELSALVVPYVVRAGSESVDGA